MASITPWSMRMRRHVRWSSRKRSWWMPVPTRARLPTCSAGSRVMPSSELNVSVWCFVYSRIKFKSAFENTWLCKWHIFVLFCCQKYIVIFHFYKIFDLFVYQSSHKSALAGRTRFYPSIFYNFSPQKGVTFCSTPVQRYPSNTWKNFIFIST